MDDVTQQNAALVEQAAAASESLEEQAEGLSNMMANFKTNSRPGEISTTSIVKTMPVSTRIETYQKQISKKS